MAKKKNRYVRTCEQCGNDYFNKKPVSVCPYCGYTNDARVKQALNKR